MSDKDRTLQDELRTRLIAEERELTTSPARRLARTALTALRGGRMVLRGGKKGREGDELERAIKIATSFGQLKGVAMKMGQILSYIDIALPEELRAALSVLQTHSQPMAFERVREIVIHDLEAHGEELLTWMEGQPLAAASIGQVHRSRLPDGTPVAVKVRYPGIDKAVAADFGAASVGTRMASIFYPGARIDGLVAEVRARFLEECDYLHEARSQQRFVALFEGHPLLMVPEVHPAYCSRRVLTTALVEGVDLERYLEARPPQQERDRLGAALFDFYVGTLFKHGLYNCDPHPGNYLFMADGRIAMLDYGCTREFEPAFVGKLVRLTRAVHADERDQLHRAFVSLGMVREGKRYDFDTARELVRSFFGPMLRDETVEMDLGQAMEVRAVMKSKRKLLKLTLPGEFVFLFRIRFGLMSVLGRLGARANWYRLERSFFP